MNRLLTPLIRCAAIWLLLLVHNAYAISSVMIWPIDPVLEESDSTTLIWLENNHSEPVYLQIRLLSWQQKDGQDIYSEQNDIGLSPPFALVQPGKRQLIRLIKNNPVPAGVEKAYRILIDEIPQTAGKGAGANQSGVQLAMRYSIPLFSSGANVWTKPDPKRSRGSTPATMPQLSYKVMQQNGRRWLEITNQGAVHARISKLNKVAGGRPITVADGLVGYVLPHSSMRLPIPSQPAIANGNRLEAMINHNSSPVVIKPAK